MQARPRLGTFQDFAFYTFSQDIRVVVVHADMVKADSSDEDLARACFPRTSDVREQALVGACRKQRVVCAVLSKEHYDLGVVFGSEIETFFAFGAEWDRASALILNYLLEIKKSPKPKVFWTPSATSVQTPSPSTPVLCAVRARCGSNFSGTVGW